VSDRFYVSLTATCDERSLSTVLDRVSAAIPTLATLGLLDGLSLSYTRDNGEGLAAETVALPAPGPVISTGPGTPPPDAVDMPVVEPEEQG
jgi:hypothetical protein